MADLTDVTAALTTKIVGSDSNGLETYPVDSTSTGDLKTVSKLQDGSGTALTSTTVSAKQALDVNIASATSITITSEGDVESSFYPDPSSFKTGETSKLRMDSDFNLRCRSDVTCDAGSFRDDFSGNSVERTMTGSVTFVNGSTTVTGSGTAFLTEVQKKTYIKLSSDGTAFFTRVLDVIDDENLVLAEGYLGTSGTGTGINCNGRYSFGNGASISIGNSLVTLSSGGTSGGFAYIQRVCDYGPLSVYLDMSISARRANQEAIIGFVDDIRNATIEKQAIIYFSGTNTSELIFRTSSSSDSSDIEETVINLPTTSTLDYRIDLTSQSATLSVEGAILARHTDHIPGPYDVMSFAAKIGNTGATSNTNLVIDVVAVSNFDTVTPNNPMIGNPQAVKVVENGAMGAIQMSGFYPDPLNWSTGEESPLLVDDAGSLQTRSSCFTDEGCFRDDFLGTQLYTSLTGTVFFTNGSTTVTGTGTSFISEVKSLSVIKLSSHADSVYGRVVDVLSDTEIELEDPYAGATASGTAYNSTWKPSTTGTGSIAVASSVCTLSSSTTNGNVAQISREADYGPISTSITMNISQRIANQTIIVGFADDIANPSIQALMVFDGTSATSLKFRTSTASDSANIQETTIVLTTLSTASTLTYNIDITPTQASLSISGTIRAVHNIHIPGPYDLLELGARIVNTGTAGSNTDVNLHTIFMNNLNVVQIANIFQGQPIQVQLVGAPNVYQKGIIDGEVTHSTTSRVAARDTTYTQQSSNAQRSVKSSSSNDSSAGTGARTIKITYYDAAYTGPYTETVTMNGTSAVNTTNTNICYVESIEVMTVGSTGSNVGTISIYTTTGGGGSAFWSIGATKNTTFSCHHYVATGRTARITSMACGTTGSVLGNGAKFYLTSQFLNVTDAVIRQITNSYTLPGAVQPFWGSFEQEVVVEGPSIIVGYVTPVSGSTYSSNLSFNFYEV